MDVFYTELTPPTPQMVNPHSASDPLQFDEDPTAAPYFYDSSANPCRNRRHRKDVKQHPVAATASTTSYSGDYTQHQMPQPTNDHRFYRPPQQEDTIDRYCPVNYHDDSDDALQLLALQALMSASQQPASVSLPREFYSSEIGDGSLQQQPGGWSSSWGLTRTDVFNEAKGVAEWGLDWTGSAQSLSSTNSTTSTFRASPYVAGLPLHGGAAPYHNSPMTSFTPSSGGGGGRSANSIFSNNWASSADASPMMLSPSGVSFHHQHPHPTSPNSRVQRPQQQRQSASEQRPAKTVSTPGANNADRKAVNNRSSVTPRVPITFVRHQFSKDDVYAMVQLLYGRSMTVRTTTRYHLLVARVILLCWKSFDCAKIADAVKNQTRLSGALGFTAHRTTNNHFFSVVVDFSNHPSAEAQCWPGEAFLADDGAAGGRQRITAGNTSFLDRLAQLTEEQEFEQYDRRLTKAESKRHDAELLEGVLGAPRLLSVHPSVDCSACDCAHVRKGNYWVAWNSDLPDLPPQLSDSLELCYTEGSKPCAARASREVIVRGWTPFCCKKIAKMHHRRLRRDGIFQSIVAHKGSQPDIVFAVKTMKVSAGIYDEKFFQLVDDEVVSVEGPFHTKIHAFKNYYCSTHQYWFSIDLFKKASDDTDWEEGEDNDTKHIDDPARESAVCSSSAAIQPVSRSTPSADQNLLLDLERPRLQDEGGEKEPAASSGVITPGYDDEGEGGQQQQQRDKDLRHTQSETSSCSVSPQQQIHRHCMRMSPFSHLDNWVFIDHFFITTGFPSFE